jgi:hypothetical protein
MSQPLSSILFVKASHLFSELIPLMFQFMIFQVLLLSIGKLILNQQTEIAAKQILQYYRWRAKAGHYLDFYVTMTAGNHIPKHIPGIHIHNTPTRSYIARHKKLITYD